MLVSTDDEEDVCQAVGIGVDVGVCRSQLGHGGQRVFYLNHPGDYEQA